MKYALFDAHGRPTAFYAPEIHGLKVVNGAANPAIPAGAVEISDEAWQALLSSNRKIWNGSAVIDRVVAQTKTSLIAYAKQRRWEIETGGVTVNGSRVETDDRSKLMILGARLRADADPDTTEDWDMPDGTTRVLSAPEIVALSDAIAAHVSTVFKTYSQVKAKIEAGTITTTEQINAEFG